MTLANASRQEERLKRSDAAGPAGPLDGTRVPELGTLIAGPFTVRLLGDFGAEVVKVEAPSRGDHYGNGVPRATAVALVGDSVPQQESDHTRSPDRKGPGASAITLDLRPRELVTLGGVKVRRLDDGPVNVRGGQVSHLLFAPEFGSSNVTVTWVRGEPGSQQEIHAHRDSEQIYVIVRGRGTMIVEGEEHEVEAGCAVLIPPLSRHAIRNTGHEPLEYVAATAPPLDSGALWQRTG
jgi:mannose-6-phosphate isomerase-like protein (cupin superfamily)